MALKIKNKGVKEAIAEMVEAVQHLETWTKESYKLTKKQQQMVVESLNL